MDGSLLASRVYAVAGAAGGLGPDVATRLAADGASLALADLSLDAAAEVAGRLSLPDDRVSAHGVDLLDPAAANAWRDEVISIHGRCDGLIHLVGGWRGGQEIDEFDLADYELLHDLLVRTVINATRAFRAPLMDSDFGRFCLVSSSVAQAPQATSAAYATAKAAAEAWTLALADSFEGTEATANVVVVNAIVTAKMREEDPGNEFQTFTSAGDIADAIAFCCSDSAKKMNGQRFSLFPSPR